MSSATVLLSLYVPGPGFLFLIVCKKGPVISISCLPHPNPNPLFEEGELEVPSSNYDLMS